MPTWISDCLFDLRFGARSFAKRPAFTAAAVLTLALGIAAATTVFSIVDAVLLRPLPYKNAGRLVAVWTTSTREASLAKIFATYRDYLEFRNHSRTLESISVATWATNISRVLTGHGPARSVLTVPVSSTFFSTLGVDAAIGRVFTKDDESRGCSIVIAHKFWTSTLNADPSIIGKTLTFDQKPCTVLGVMPPRFSFYPAPTQAWILITRDFQPNLDHLLVGIFARLQPGATSAQAQSELRTSTARSTLTANHATSYRSSMISTANSPSSPAARCARL
ncbi:MAG TPA: ABC transporter permease [Bryobacteraceae bacterium]|jgi:putative ABC transport system permease protein